jgi:hypothetical protein
MPFRQIRKNSKSKSHRRNSKRNQRGGDPGRIALPPAYWGQGTRGYLADGSQGLSSCDRQHAVSQGVISPDGKWAGPNLYPMLGGNKSRRTQKRNNRSKSHQRGGGCGCSRRRKMTADSKKLAKK